MAEPLALPPLVTATQFGQLAVVKLLAFQHLLEAESEIEMLTEEMPLLPVPESLTVPVTAPGQPAAL